MASDDYAQLAHLPCGTVLDDLIAQITDGTAPADRAHQAACRYCQAALEAVRDAWEEFQAVARSAVAIPEGLADRILQRIRHLAAVNRDGLVVELERGHTQIAAGVLAQLARHAALAVPDVVLATVLGAEAEPEGPDGVHVSLRLVVVLGRSLEQIAAAVREHVVASLQEQAGTLASRVDIAVEDIVLGDEVA